MAGYKYLFWIPPISCFRRCKQEASCKYLTWSPSVSCLNGTKIRPRYLSQLVESPWDSIEYCCLPPVIKLPDLTGTSWNSGCPFYVLSGPCSVTHFHPITLFLHVLQTANHFVILFFSEILKKNTWVKAFLGNRIYWSKCLNSNYIGNNVIDVGVFFVLDLPQHSLLNWLFPPRPTKLFKTSSVM